MPAVHIATAVHTFTGDELRMPHALFAGISIRLSEVIRGLWPWRAGRKGRRMRLVNVAHFCDNSTLCSSTWP